MALNPRASRSGSANSSSEPGGIFQGKITLVYGDGTVRVFVKYLGINIGPCRIVGKEYDEQFQVNDEVLVVYLDNLKSEMFVIGRLTDRPGAESATTEPIGHEDKTESALSFVNATRIFTIAPVGDSFTVWCTGTRYVKTAAESITLPATSGLYYIYYSATGVLSYKTTYFTWDQDAPTAYIYYNAATEQAEFFADERHGVILDWATHEYLHRTRGASLAEGLGASGYTLSGTGNNNADIQISIADGAFFDEDLEVNITHSATPTANTWEQRLQGPAYIPMFYRSGSGGAWVMDTATAYPVKYGSARATYNLSSSGTWSTPDMTSGKFGVTWIVATNNLNEPVIGIMGQTQSDNIGQAEEITYADLDLDGLPIVEIRPLYKLIFETNTGYTNAVKSRLAAISDIRASTSVNIDIGAAALSSLTDVSLTTSATNDILAYDGSAWTNTNTPIFQSATIIGGVVVDTSTLIVDATNNRVGIGTASPLVALDVIGEVIARAAATQDGVRLLGRSGGTGYYDVALTPTTLSADRTLTLPDVSGTVITTGDTGTVTSTMILDGTIVNGDINASAAIADTKLATISTAGKVSNSATTATSSNTASSIVARDSSGNFTAGTITATLSGSASTLTTTRTIWGQNFNGSANVSGALSGATTISASSSVTASSFNVDSTHYLYAVSGDYGSLQVTGNTNSYAGYSINGNAVFMSNGSSFGLYDDTNNQWFMYKTFNGDSRFYYAGTERILIKSDGVSIRGDSSGTGVNGTLNAYAYYGNSNVAGTGDASYHPAGIYSTNTNYFYGTTYWNGNTQASVGHGQPAANNTYYWGLGIFGVNAWSYVGAYNFYNPSDIRYKQNVAPLPLGMNFLRLIDPIKFTYLYPQFTEESGNTPVSIDAGTRYRAGLSAQNVKAALNTLGADDYAFWALIDKDDTENSVQTLDYTGLIAPVIQALKELDAKVSELTEKISALEAQNG